MERRKRLLLRAALALALGLFLVPAIGLAETQDDRSTNGNERSGPRVRILANGLYNATAASFGESSTFERYVEQGRSMRDYEASTGFAFEAGVIVNLTSSIGVMASFENFDGELDATFREEIPHPLYFDQTRSVSGELSGLSYSERAIHVDFVFSRALDAVTIDLFAGPTFFNTTAEVITAVNTASDYPFDDIALAGTVTSEVDDNPIGFNAGGALTFRLTEVVGVAFQARYSQGSASLARSGGSAMDFDTGGLRVGGGIRLAF